MKKIADNVIITKIGDTLKLTQSGEDFTMIETSKIEDNFPDLETCVSSDKFFGIYEKSSTLELTTLGLEIITNKTKAILPIMKEYGDFLVSKELHETGNCINSFKANYKNIDIDLANAAGQFLYIMLNENFVCRYLYNTLFLYGEIKGDYYCLSPKQFKRLKDLGECTLEIYPEYIVAKTENTKLILKQFVAVVNLKLLDRFFNSKSLCTFTMPVLDFKKIKLFVETDFHLSCVDSVLTLEAPGYTETTQIAEPNINFNGIFYLKDLEYLKGELSIYKESRIFYGISKYDDKTVLFVGEGLE